MRHVTSVVVLALAVATAGLVADPAPFTAAPAVRCVITPDPVVARVIDISPAGGGTSIARAVNAAGTVVGSVVRDGPEAFVWTAQGGATTITPGVALGINASGVVVGHTSEPGLLSRPFRWTAAQGLQILPTLGGPAGGASAINASGEIVGWAQLRGGGATHAALWRSNGVVEDLGTLGSDTLATRITDQGIVAGWGRTASGAIHAFVWTRPAGRRDLGPGAAWGLNSRGTAVGGTPSSPGTSYLWPWFGDRLSLGSGQARAMTSYDMVVGGRHPDGDEEDVVATAWIPGRGAHALGTLGGCRSLALDANDAGRIVGFSQDAFGTERATVWDVPRTIATAVVSVDEDRQALPPAPLVRRRDLAGLGTGTATRVNAAGEALVLDSVPRTSAPNRTFLWRPPGDRIDLGGFGEIVATVGTALNEHGTIVGEALSSRGFYEPFIWRAGSSLSLLEPDHIVEDSPPTAINKGEQVSGGLGVATAFRWDPVNGLVQRNPLGGSCGSSARAVSRAGEVVGASSLAGQGCEDTDPNHAYLWRRNGAVIDLGTLGGRRSEAVAINGLGQVTGWSQTRGGATHGFFWSSATGMIDIGTLGGAWSRPVAINNRGEVTGTSLTTLGFSHGFVWSMRTRMVGLGAGAPAASNVLGHVVGTTSKTDQAFFWAELGGRIPLSYRARAFDINERGDIVGDRRFPGGPEATRWRVRTAVVELLDAYDVQAAARRYDGTFSAADVAATRADTAAARVALFTGDEGQLAKRLQALADRFSPYF